MPDYATEDGGETVDLQVMNPFEALARQERREHILHPPQFVEISRLARFQKMNDLSRPVYLKSMDEEKHKPNDVL